MKVIKVDLPAEHSEIEIHTFADLHLGDKHTNKKLIKERIEYVKNTPHAYALLNGDLMNNATKTSVSDSYAEEIPPMEQIQLCTELFEPIKDKILAICTGNHESRTYNKEGIDLMNIFSRQIGCKEKFSKVGTVVFLDFGQSPKHGKGRKNIYSLYMTHGSGGGRKEGAKAIRLADMASIVDVDVYIHSHTHLPMTMKQGFYRSHRLTRTVEFVEKLFVNTGATLEYGGYGQAFEFKPASLSTPIIYLGGRKIYADSRL